MKCWNFKGPVNIVSRCFPLSFWPLLSLGKSLWVSKYCTPITGSFKYFQLLD